MPTIASSVVPPPKSWDEFEDIMLAAAKLRWNSDGFQRQGRPGQKQDGVDIFGHGDDDRHIGVQCKNSVGGLTLETIEKEVDNAEAFEPKLDRLYVATTAKRDAALQREVRTLSEARRKSGKFRVGILFWDEVCQDLVTDDDVFFAHYPQFRSRVDPAQQHDQGLYNQLTKLLRSDGVIGFLDRTNMAGFSFQLSALEPLRELHYEWNRPEREFMAPSSSGYGKPYGRRQTHTYGLSPLRPSPHTIDRNTVPPEWEVERPDRFWCFVKALHELAGEIVVLHADFVRTGRNILIGAVR